MNTLDEVLTLPTAFLLLGIYIVAFGVRRFVEALWPTLSTATPTTVAERVWEEFVLPTLPALLGLAFCLLCPSKLFPYPAVVASSWVSKALYGLSTGWFAAWGYRVVKALLQKRWNIAFPDDSTPPPAVKPAMPVEKLPPAPPLPREEP